MATKIKGNAKAAGKAKAAPVDPDEPATWPEARVDAALAALNDARNLAFLYSTMTEKARFLLHADPSAARDGLLLLTMQAIETQRVRGLPPAGAMVDKALELARAAGRGLPGHGFETGLSDVLRAIRGK